MYLRMGGLAERQVEEGKQQKFMEGSRDCSSSKNGKQISGRSNNLRRQSRMQADADRIRIAREVVTVRFRCLDSGKG